MLAGGARRTAQRLGGGSGGALGPAGLIAVVFMTHLLAGDWLSALDPRWLSTAFPLVWLIGQAFVNIAVVLGVIPVLGVPLPLISAGGTAMISSMIAIGIVLSFARQSQRDAQAAQAAGETIDAGAQR